MASRTASPCRRLAARLRDGRTSWRSSRRRPTTRIWRSTRTSRSGWRWLTALPSNRLVRSRKKARPSSGSTAGCTRPRRWARSSSAKWSTRWSAGPTKRPCDSWTRRSFSSSTRTRMATIWLRTGTCGRPIRSCGARQVYRACIRSTSATTTIATSLRPPRRKPRTSTASCITSGCRRSSTTTTRADLQERSCGRHRSAIHTTTTSTLCWCSVCRRSGRTCTRDWPAKASRVRRWRLAARMTAGGTAASGTPETSTTSSRS